MPFDALPPIGMGTFRLKGDDAREAVRSALSLGWSAAAVWLLAWAVQVWGHKVEGKKPSFVDDLVFLLIGPIFVSVEMAQRVGLPVGEVR